MIQISLNSLLLAFHWSLIVICVGCVGSPADGFSGGRGQVVGTVTLDGEPVDEGCQVTFLSQTGNYMATAVTGPDGTYSLQYKFTIGLPVGDYSVQITPPLPQLPPTSLDPSKVDMSTFKAKPLAGKGGSSPGRPGEGVIPLRYTLRQSSGLRFTVSSGKNTADFDLESSTETRNK